MLLVSRGMRRAPTGPRANYGGTNSDLAFDSKYLFNGNYNGINIYDISDPAHMTLGHVHRLPRRPGRRFRLQEPALHVGGSRQRPHRLRHEGFPTSSTSAQPPPAPPAPTGDAEADAAAMTAFDRACLRPAPIA